MTVTKGAVLSDCGRYRYQLTRTWSDEPLLWFVMLNPSTADATDDDPTIRRCIRFGRDLGYGGIGVVNLYAWRATDPKDLFAAEKAGEDVIGPDNLGHQYDVLDQGAGPVIAAWGANARPAALTGLLSLPNQHRLHALDVTKAGMPKHPLYLPAAARPEPWSAPATTSA